MHYILNKYHLIEKILKEQNLIKLKEDFLVFIKEIKEEYHYIFAVIIDHLAYKIHKQLWKKHSLEQELFNSSIGKSNIIKKMKQAIEKRDFISQKIYGMVLKIINYKGQLLEKSGIIGILPPIAPEIQVFFQPNYNILSDPYLKLFFFIIIIVIFLDSSYLLWHGIKSFVITRGV